jgi:hypothetical protein
MKRILIAGLSLLILVAAPLSGRAEWGWPPPGYSASTFRACDGSQYRGLCAVLRDRRHGAHPCCDMVSPTPCDGACSLPAAPAAPVAPQPQDPGGTHR